MSVSRLGPELHRDWGWRPYVKPHALPMAGCSYSLETWPNEAQRPGWWAVHAFVDDYGDMWTVTSN